MLLFLKFIFAIKFYMFRIVALSNIRILQLYTQQYIMVLLTACEQTVSKPVWHIA